MLADYTTPDRVSETSAGRVDRVRVAAYGQHMEMGVPAMDPEVREGLRRSWKALMAIGVLAIFIGCVAIVVPAVASVGTAIFIGWVLVIAGGFLVAGAFMAHSIDMPPNMSATFW